MGEVSPPWKTRLWIPPKPFFVLFSSMILYVWLKVPFWLWVNSGVCAIWNEAVHSPSRVAKVDLPKNVLKKYTFKLKLSSLWPSTTWPWPTVSKLCCTQPITMRCPFREDVAVMFYLFDCIIVLKKCGHPCYTPFDTLRNIIYITHEVLPLNHFKARDVIVCSSISLLSMEPIVWSEFLCNISLSSSLLYLVIVFFNFKIFQNVW